MSDKVLVMNHGSLVMDGTPEDVFSRGDELKAMGLALPDSMEMIYRLNEAGFGIEKSCLTMGEAAVEIARALKE